MIDTNLRVNESGEMVHFLIQGKAEKLEFLPGIVGSGDSFSRAAAYHIHGTPGGGREGYQMRAFFVTFKKPQLVALFCEACGLRTCLPNYMTKEKLQDHFK